MINNIINFLYFLISLFDRNIQSEEKMIEDYDIDNIEILSDMGFHKLSKLYITKPFEIYTIKLENGYKLDCADTHILFDKNYNEIFVKDLNIGDLIITDQGPKKVISIKYNKNKICMGDVTVDHPNHRFYSNGILSHNSTTTAIFCLWVILFNPDTAALILSKSGPAGVDLLHKIKDMFLHLPYWLKPGIYKWNQHEISFDNNSKIATEAFSPTAGLGQTINFLILDEFAWTPPNETELFYMNVIPTVTTMPNAKVCIMSTQNGFNFFYKLWHAAILHESDYAPFKVDWWQVPDYDLETDTWVKRTEEWKKKMIGILGSEEYFYYQYGTQFSSSNYCLISREKMAEIRNDAIDYTNDWRDKLDLFLQFPENLYFDPNFDFELFRKNESHFILLVDLAEGGGGDFTVFNILQIESKDKIKQIGYWRSNKVNLEMAGLDFWMLCVQLFNNGKSLISIEWNTYGALFYNILSSLNEYEVSPELGYRFNIKSNGDEQQMDLNSIVHYKKELIDIPGVGVKKEKRMVPGIKMTKTSKSTACTLLKLHIESALVKINDIVTVTELENFEDSNGNGSYEAVFGHDDLIMTFVQLPLLMQTMYFKNLMEDIEAENIINNSSILNDTINYNGTIYDVQAPSINPIFDNGFDVQYSNHESLAQRIFNMNLHNFE